MPNPDEKSGSTGASAPGAAPKPILLPTMEDLQRILGDQMERERLDRGLKREMDRQRLQQSAGNSSAPVAGPPGDPFADSKPRPGEVGDVLNAIVKVPAVEKALDNLKNKASSKLKSGWKDLSTDGKAAVIVQGVVITGAAVGGALGTETRRRKVFDLIRDRNIPIPIPNTPVSLEFKTGKETKIMIKLDIMDLLRR